MAIRPLLVVALLAGCVEPPADERTFPAWGPTAREGSPQRMADGSFLFLDAAGTVRQLGVEPFALECDLEGPSAHVDVAQRRLVLPEHRMREWNPDATLLVRDQVHAYHPASSCNVPHLHAPSHELRFWGPMSQSGLLLRVSALETGVAIGEHRVLGDGDTYHHVAYWDEVDPATGEQRTYKLDVIFTARGVWHWQDAVVGAGDTTWT